MGEKRRALQARLGIIVLAATMKTRQVAVVVPVISGSSSHPSLPSAHDGPQLLVVSSRKHAGKVNPLALVRRSSA
jgi:hypothetical protein